MSYRTSEAPSQSSSFLGIMQVLLDHVPPPRKSSMLLVGGFIEFQQFGWYRTGGKASDTTSKFRVLRLISGQVYKNQECWWKFLWPAWGGFQWKKLHGSAVLWYICIGELYKHQNELCVTPLLHVRWKLCFIQQSISTLPWPTSEVCRSCKSFSEYSPCIHLCSSGSSWVFITYHELLFSCVELLQAVLFSVRTVSW